MNEKKRVLVLNYEFPPLGGGAANATYYLLKEFSKYPDLEIELITSSIGKSKIIKFSKNITIHYLDIGKGVNLHYQSIKELLNYSYRAYKYSMELIKKNKKEKKSFDLCHAFFGIPCGYIAMKLKMKYNLNYIVSLRGSDVPFYNKRFYLLDRFIFRRLSNKIWRNAREIIANSEGLKELALISNPNQKISVICNGINTDEFKPGRNNSKLSKIRLISTGRLIKRKGYYYLIKALKDNHNVELTIIGDGDLREELQELSRKNKVRTYFLGNINHKKLPHYLRNADIFILPSLNEGMSNSILEAMACGLPVITTNTGGSKELVKNNGIIVTKADPKSLNEAIRKFIDSPHLISSMGIKSRQLAQKMSWKIVAREYRRRYYR